MSETQEPNNYRAEIASRNRRRTLRAKDWKYSMAIFGLMAYSAVANLIASVASIMASPLDAGFCLVLGILYAFGSYRVWVKDDIRWWPIAIPAGISIAVLLLAWIGGVPRPAPLALNIILLVLVPIRKHAAAAAARMDERSP